MNLREKFGTAHFELANDDQDEFDALAAVGIPQLIAHQIEAGKLCHNKVSKQIYESLEVLAKK